MMNNNYKKMQAEKLLAAADIKIGGSRPFDITIINPATYDRVFSQGSLGLGESYMEGWWECQALDQFFTKLFLAKIPDQVGKSLPLVFEIIKTRLLNLQIGKKAFEIGKKHYDLGNDFFEAMIGKSMMYSCAYWKEAQNLDSAQYAKLDLICKKLNLQPGQRILEIGCGWGAFAKYAAQKYNVSVVGITVSKEQLAYAKNICKGLPIEFRFEDYHQLDEKFDHVVSIAMFEAVGLKNYRTFMEVVKRCLKPGGLFLLHTIGGNISATSYEPWFDKYIFPNSFLPSLKQITASAEKLFVIEDVHNFGADYDKTLMAWRQNFKDNWPTFSKKYGQTFYRMWEYYLLSCAGLFRARELELWHIVLSPNGVPGGYRSVR